MGNWMQFKLIGSRVHMKKNVVPHKFIDEQTNSTTTCSFIKKEEVTPWGQKKSLL